MIFAKNKYTLNEKRNRIAGQPILVVEVWSDSNTQQERTFKRYLYSTSPITEHWYIEQNSDTVECYLGETQLKEQNLNFPLKTNLGLELDLSYVSIKNRDF